MHIHLSPIRSTNATERYGLSRECEHIDKRLAEPLGRPHCCFDAICQERPRRPKVVLPTPSAKIFECQDGETNSGSADFCAQPEIALSCKPVAELIRVYCQVFVPASVTIHERKALRFRHLTWNTTRACILKARDWPQNGRA